MRPGKLPTGRSWMIVGTIAVIGVLGLGLARWPRDPWPPRATFRPPDGGWPQGFTRDGRAYRTSGARGVTRWDAATGREVGVGPLPVIWRRGWADDGRSYAGMVAGANGQVVVRVDAATDEIRERFPVPGRNVLCPRLVAGGRAIRAVLVANQQAHEVATWDLATGAEVRRAVAGPAHLIGIGRANPIAYAPDGRTWAYLDPTQGGILLWDADADRPRGPILATPARTAVGTFSPDGRTLAVGRDGGRVESWDLATGRLIRSVVGHPGDFVPDELEFSADGRTLALGAHEPAPPGLRTFLHDQYNGRVPSGWQIPYAREVVVIDVATGAVLARLPGSFHPQLSPDGRTLATHERGETFSLRAVPRGLDP